MMVGSVDGEGAGISPERAAEISQEERSRF